jgi:putative NIF3 family GTP cyclohydrolase 1 type 2
MIAQNHLTTYLDEYLKTDQIEDSCWNGLQIEGKKDISKLAIAVDAGQEVFKQATQAQADYLIVHHGHFWKSANPSLAGWQKKRLQPLLDSHISLYASHLPLDRHEEVGNNVLLLKLIGASVTGDFHNVNGQPITWLG